MAIILKPKKSTTASAVPTTATLADGEMAVNTTDRKWYVRVGAAIVDMFAGLVARTDTVGVHTSVRQTDARYSEGNGSRTGFYKITLPVTWNNTMPMIRIVGRHYSQAQYWEMVIGGYLYTAGSAWSASAVYLVGGAFPSSWKVRLGHDGTNCCIVIGDTSGSGNVGSTSIEVKDFVSRGPIPDTGWSVSVLTSDTGITYSGADNADGSKNLLSADQDITLASTRSIYKTDLAGSGGASKTGAFLAQRWAYSAGAVVFKSANLATTSAFFSIRVRGFHYSVGVIDTIISSYLASGTFNSVYKTVAGSYDIPIRLAVSPDGYVCVLVGDTTTSGHRFFVLESYLGSNALTLTSGWTSSEVTDYSTYTNVTTPNQTALAANVASAALLTTGRTINGTTFNGSTNITTATWGAACTLSYTGDVTGSASVNGSSNVSFAMTLAASGVTAGTYRSVTVDAKGRVTAGTNPTTVSGFGITDAVTNGGSVSTIVKLTQAAYDALGTKDANTLYVIVG